MQIVQQQGWAQEFYTTFDVFIFENTLAGTCEIFLQSHVLCSGSTPVGEDKWRSMDSNRQRYISMKTLLYTKYFAYLLRYWKWSMGPAQWSMDQSLDDESFILHFATFKLFSLLIFEI